MLVTRKSMVSDKFHTFDLPVTQEQLDEYFNGDIRGRLIQDIFPDLDPDQREFILTGITPEEWDQTFPPDDMLSDEELDDEPAF